MGRDICLALQEPSAVPSTSATDFARDVPLSEARQQVTAMLLGTHSPSNVTADLKGTALAVIIITARTGNWVQANRMEHRGARYAIRVGIARGQWCVAIHRPGADLPTERTVVGTREEALATARSMINALLKKTTRPKPAPELNLRSAHWPKR